MSKVQYQFSALCSLYHKESASFLDQALKSLEEQTLPATEVVVVHDGPLTEELYKSLANWKKTLPIKEVILKKNVGLGKALNAGLDSCSFDLVARFDTDDINTPDRFKSQVTFMAENPHVDLVSTDINEFEHIIGDISSKRKLPSTHNELKKVAKYRNPVNHMAVVFRKSAVLEVGSYKDLHFMEDYYLWLRLLAAKKVFANITKPLVHARVGNGMHKRRKGIKYIKSEFKLFNIKRQHKVTSLGTGVWIFALRATPRLMPSGLVKLLYKKLRKKG